MIYKPIMFALVFSLVLPGCDGDEPMSLNRETEGYHFAVKIIESGLSRGECSNLMEEAFEVFKNRIEMIESDNGALKKLNSGRVSVEVPVDLYGLLSEVESFHAATEDLWDVRIGGLRELWGIDSDVSLTPGSVELDSALQVMKQTEIELLDKNRVSLKGDGMLYFGRVALGWAVDGAAQVMIEGGVGAGSVEVDGIHRLWGKTSPENNHVMTVKPLLNDSTIYSIAADPGGLCSIYLRDVEAEIDGEELTGLINPLTGMPVPGYLNLTVWAPDATAACLYAEAMYVMKPGLLMRWVEMNDSVSVFVVKDDAVGMFAETDSRMDNWVTLNLP
ncbi:FAD:protein FMN transferase [bacterium]|nr:FAD:protein FMN transferase [bacterium]